LLSLQGATRRSSLDGACTNQAEEYFCRLRRAEIGIHHDIAGAYLLRYAQESSWREDNRRVSNGDQLNRIAALAMKPADDDERVKARTAARWRRSGWLCFKDVAP
jgi:hypothetical protein